LKKQRHYHYHQRIGDIFFIRFDFSWHRTLQRLFFFDQTFEQRFVFSQ